MKRKSFLLSTLAVLLAGLSFGGVSFATDCAASAPCQTPGTLREVMDWNASYALNYYDNGVGFTSHPRLDGSWTPDITAEHINYSNLTLKDQGDDGDVKHIGLLGILFFEPTAVDVSQVTFEFNTYYRNGSRIFNSTSYSNEDGRHHTSFRYRITPDLVKQTLAAGSHTITGSFAISGTDRVEYSSEIDITNFTMYTGDDTNNVLFKVVNGDIVKDNGNDVHKVIFNSNGGSEVATGRVEDGYVVAEPATPTKAGYKFVAWFTDEEFSTPAYDFSTPVTANVTLYAKWKKKSSGSSSSSSSSSTTTNTGDTNTGTNNTGAVETGTVDTGTVDTGTNNNEETVNPTDSATQENGYTKEFNDAYQFAFANGITTMKSIKEAAMEDGLTRIAMAKMLSQYAINVLKKTPDTSKECKFGDVSAELDAQYDHGVTLACQLGIMGVGITDFRPNDPVVRAEFGTALSRLLFGLEDGVEAYYTTHLAKLKAEGIISNDDPTLEELRGYVMLMLMRSAK